MLIETFSQRAVDLYLVGFLIATNLLAAWFHSNFPQHIWNMAHPWGEKVYTKDDLTTQAVEAYGTLGDLWVCPICFGTWLSVIVAGFVATVGGLDGTMWIKYVGTAALTWPAGYAIVHKFLSR